MADEDGRRGRHESGALSVHGRVRALTNMVRLHGRSARGTRALGAAPFGHWTRVTVLGALGAEGIVTAMSVEAATNAAVFHVHLDQVLLPELRHSEPDAVLVMDNLRLHKALQVRRCSTARALLTATCPPTRPI